MLNQICSRYAWSIGIMHDIWVGLQRDDLSACMPPRNSISVRYPMLRMPRLQRQAVVHSMRITIRHIWTHVSMVPWFDVPAEDGGFDRRIQQAKRCFGHMQQLASCRPRRASHGVDLYMLPLIPFKSMYFGTSPQNSVVRIYPSHFACGFPFPP